MGDLPSHLRDAEDILNPSVLFPKLTRASGGGNQACTRPSQTRIAIVSSHAHYLFIVLLGQEVLRDFAWHSAGRAILCSHSQSSSHQQRRSKGVTMADTRESETPIPTTENGPSGDSGAPSTVTEEQWKAMQDILAFAQPQLHILRQA